MKGFNVLLRLRKLHNIQITNHKIFFFEYVVEFIQNTSYIV